MKDHKSKRENKETGSELTADGIWNFELGYVEVIDRSAVYCLPN